MDNSAPGDHKGTDAIMAREQAFKDQVRQMRQDRPLQTGPADDVWHLVDGHERLDGHRRSGHRDMSF